MLRTLSVKLLHLPFAFGAAVLIATLSGITPSLGQGCVGGLDPDSDG